MGGARAFKGRGVGTVLDQTGVLMSSHVGKRLGPRQVGTQVKDLAGQETQFDCGSQGLGSV